MQHRYIKHYPGYYMLNYMLNYRERSQEIELMDDLGVDGETLDLALRDLSWVHRVLGGGRATLSALSPLLAELYVKLDRPVRLIDAGCGGGDALVELNRWSKNNRIPLELTGIDANPACLEYTNSRMNGEQVQLMEHDIFSEKIKWADFDVVHFGLVLHHFEEDMIIDLLRTIYENSQAFIVINDLQRSRLAYQLFRLVSRLSSFSDMARNDGLISVRRGFIRSDWRKMTESAGIKQYKLSWQWAFRFIIQIEPQSDNSFALDR